MKMEMWWSQPMSVICKSLPRMLSLIAGSHCTRVHFAAFRQLTQAARPQARHGVLCMREKRIAPRFTPWDSWNSSVDDELSKQVDGCCLGQQPASEILSFIIEFVLNRCKREIAISMHFLWRDCFLYFNIRIGPVRKYKSSLISIPQNVFSSYDPVGWRDSNLHMISLWRSF